MFRAGKYIASDKCISALRGRSIVVISDAYPPFTTGGAEISLSNTLNALPEDVREKIVVFTSAGKINNINFAYSNRVMVVRVPSAASFPFEDMSNDQRDTHPLKSRIGPKYFGRFQMIRRLLAAKNKKDIILARKESRLSPKGGILTDHLSPKKNHITVRIYLDLISKMSAFETLVADNTRSILIGSYLLEQMSPQGNSFAIVRDNRFHCPRPTQSANIKGKMCVTPCKFECAKIDCAADPGLRTVTLKRLYEHRQQALNAYSNVITTSHQLVRHLQPVLRDSSELIRIPNSYGSPEQIDTYCRSVAEVKRINIVIIGMLTENKGQLEFIKASGGWLNKNRDVTLILIGRGDRIQKAIVNFIKNKPVRNQIKMIGFKSRKTVFEEIRKATLVIAPTIWPEPFGRVPLEAGMARRAIVAFGVGGLNETIVDGYSGFIVRPRDYRAMHEKIDILLDNPSIRKQFENNARDFIEERYGSERTNQKYADVVFQ